MKLVGFYIKIVFICFIVLELASFLLYQAVVSNVPKSETQFDEKLAFEKAKKVYPAFDGAEGGAKYVGHGGYDVWLGSRLIARSKTYGLQVNRSGYVSNRGGGKEDVVSLRPAPGIKRIVLLGSSTVVGVGVSRNEDTIAAQLERMLNESGEKYEVINGGVPSYASAHSLVYTALEVLDINPDLVVTFDVGGDIGNACFNPIYVPNRSTRSRTLEKAFPLAVPYIYSVKHAEYSRYISDQLSQYLRIFVTQSSIMKLLTYMAQPKVVGQQFTCDDRGIDRYIENVKRMAALLKGMQVAYLGVLQPQLSYEKTATEEEAEYLTAVEKGYKNYRENVHYFFSKTVGPFAKLGEELNDEDFVYLKDFSGMFHDVHETIYSDANHYNVAGNKMIAGKLADEIRKIRRM